MLVFAGGSSSLVATIKQPWLFSNALPLLFVFLVQLEQGGGSGFAASNVDDLAISLFVFPRKTTTTNYNTLLVELRHVVAFSAAEQKRNRILYTLSFVKQHKKEHRH